MYMLTLKYAQLNLDASAYTELRKLIDAGMSSTFRYVVYAALFSNLALVISTIRNPGSLLFLTATIALVALITDTAIAVKCNIPINEAINSWTLNTFPPNWAEYRTKWLQIFQYRQIANITGFVSLLIGAVFRFK